MVRMLAPGSSRIRSFTINGFNINPLSVREAEITESLMRPFQTLEIVFGDNENVINRLNLVGGEDVRFIFDDGYGYSVYDMKMKIHSIGEESSTGNNRMSLYRINCVGYTYWNNRISGRVQHTFRNIVGTEAIKIIHDQYLKATDAQFFIEPSKGFIAEMEPYMVSNQTPFQTIDNIRVRLTSDRFNTGAYCYYRDSTQYNLRQLESLFYSISPTIVLLNDPTVGTSIRDYERVRRNMMNLQTGTTFSGPGGRASMMDSAANGTRVQTNYFSFGETYNRGRTNDPQQGTLVGRPANITRGSQEFARQYRAFPGDPRLTLIDPIAEKADREMLYVTTVMGGPCFTAQVMIEAGLKMTVGKGIFADLPAPVGAGNQTTQNLTKGVYLVVNLKHKISTNSTTPMGVTTFEAIRGGYNS